MFGNHFINIYKKINVMEEDFEDFDEWFPDQQI
jgi:hypothetical protein